MSEKIPNDAVELFKYITDVQMDRGLNVKGRSFTLLGEVTMDMFHRLEACLSFFENEGDESITIKLCSEGGEVYSALAIVGRIKASPCHIVIEAFGQIMSAATVIFAVGDERISSEHTSFMFHQSSVSMPEQLKIRDIEVEVAQSKHEEEMFNNILEKHTKMDANYWGKLTKSAKNVYRTAAECMELGLVDKIK